LGVISLLIFMYLLLVCTHALVHQASLFPLITALAAAF